MKIISKESYLTNSTHLQVTDGPICDREIIATAADNAIRDRCGQLYSNVFFVIGSESAEICVVTY